jgi:hypothetical protein
MEPKVVKLRSLGKHRYKGRDLKTGDEFEADEKEADDLCSSPIGLAERIVTKDEDEKPRRGYKRRDMEAEE